MSSSGGMPAIPDFKPKSFWERPEGTPGMVVGALLIVGGSMVLYKLLPFIIVLFSMINATLTGMITAVALGAVLLILLAIVTNKRFWTLGGYMFRSAMRAIASAYTEVDPIGIMNNYVEDLKVLYDKMDRSVQELRAKMKRLEMDISKNKEDMGNALAMASRARKEGKQALVVLKVRRAGRLEQSTMTLEQLYKKLELIYRVLVKMAEVCGFMIEDTDDEVKVRAKEFEAIKAAESAVGAAMKIIRGQTASRELFDLATEQVANRVARGYAELEHFTDLSKGFIDSVDLQNGIFEESALAKLEEWEKRGDSILLGDDKDRIIQAVEDPTNQVDLEAAAAPIPASARMKALIEGGGKQ